MFDKTLGPMFHHAEFKKLVFLALAACVVNNSNKTRY